MTPPVDIRGDHLRIVQDVLRRHLPDGVTIWVFGSRATWMTKDSSDLDLALEGDTAIPPRSLFTLEVAFEDSDLPFAVDIVDVRRINERFRRIVAQQRVRLPERGSRATGGRSGGLGICPDWREMPFTEAFLVNPPTQVDRGSSLPFVDMATVDPSFRSVRASKVREFRGGGSRFRDGDTLMARITPCLENGKVARYCAEGAPEPAHGSTEFIVVRGCPGTTDTEFAYYMTRSSFVRDYAIGQMTGTSGRQRVPTESLEHLTIAVPSLPEQRAVAHILGTLDDKIELNRRMNATLGAMAQALFKSWFVDFDPVRAKMAGRDTGLPKEIADLFPDRLVDSELGEIPEGWGVGVLDDAMELLNGGTPRTSVERFWNGDIPWYTAKDAPVPRDVFAVETERTITQAGVDNSATIVLPSGTTVISARGSVGRLACLGRPMAMNQTCYGIRGAGGYGDFFTYWLVRGAVEALRSRTHGTIFDTITRQTFALVDLALPPVSVADAFESVVLPIMERILSNLHQSGAIVALRDTLLPKLVSGEMRICGTEKLVGALA